jgi:hypothetical protein
MVPIPVDDDETLNAVSLDDKSARASKADDALFNVPPKPSEVTPPGAGK